MPDDPAFIRAIAASPDDDAPRLVYADYLEETGDPVNMARAEFIRVQIEKARLVPDTPRWTELWYRDTALLEWAREWRAELPEIRGVVYGGFLRGFIDRVDAIEGVPFVKRARQVFDRVPVRRLRVRDLHAEQLKSLIELSDLTHVCELDITVMQPTPESLHLLSDRGPWRNLRRLSAWFELQESDHLAAAYKRFRRVFAGQLFP